MHAWTSQYQCTKPDIIFAAPSWASVEKSDYSNSWGIAGDWKDRKNERGAGRCGRIKWKSVYIESKKRSTLSKDRGIEKKINSIPLKTKKKGKKHATSINFIYTKLTEEYEIMYEQTLSQLK